jgi:exopolyphosphatase / guanosine-5'-triphosphate,3'-diphosphate pyrophosphatase
MKVSVVDLGYNSLKLVNYIVKPDRSFTAYSQRSVLARIGEGLDETGFLKDEAIVRTIKALKLFQEVVRFEGADKVLPVATSAVREAGNKDQFLQQAYKETGLSFKVLSQREEAFCSFAGASNATNAPTGLFFDLGGGSLEIVLAANFKPRKILSVPLGGLRLTDLYAKTNGKFTKKSYARMADRIQELLPDKKDLKGLKKPELVGVGGSVRTLARYHQMLINYPLDKVHNYSLKESWVELMHNYLQRLKPKEIENIPVIGQERARSIIAGSLVVERLMRSLGFDRLIVSTHGLRDGVLSAYLQNPSGYNKGPIENILTQIDNRKPPRLSQRTLNVVRLFASRNLVSGREESLICSGVEEILGDGPPMDPETLFYLIINRDSSLAHTNQVMMALAIVRAKGLRRAEWLYDKYRDILGKNARETIARVSAVLHMLEILEKTRSTLEHSTQKGNELFIRITPGKSPFPSNLFNNAVKDMGNAFGINMHYSLNGSVA